MLRIGKLTDYGVLLLTDMAAAPAQLRSATELAEKHHLGGATVAKVLKLLSKAGLLETVRGSGGGYRLCCGAEDVKVSDIIAALEGPIALTECSVHDGNCSIESDCGVRTHWQVINNAVHSALDKVTLADLCRPAKDIETTVIPLEAVGGLSR
ncbi:MAG: SUF system Fe-S cluster assembly regulator [Gammaproteobacteria bacterium]|nr:SUF system Fe-S cluster assembly regulator [Gammaproteobacteria bacterium]